MNMKLIIFILISPICQKVIAVCYRIKSTYYVSGSVLRTLHKLNIFIFNFSKKKVFSLI
jgi:hypothetical protein